MFCWERLLFDARTSQRSFFGSILVIVISDRLEKFEQVAFPHQFRHGSHEADGSVEFAYPSGPLSSSQSVAHLRSQPRPNLIPLSTMNLLCC